MPHVVLIFGEVTIEEIDDNRPLIKGVDRRIAKCLGEHEDEQGWKFIIWNDQVALLIPKRYVLLKMFRILGIFLHFENGRQAQARSL
jgi:hypothetical protein